MDAAELTIAMSFRFRFAPLLLAVPLLAACEQDRAAYMIDDNSDHALTLQREVKYPWSDKAELALVVARFPECQRRHEMKPQPAASSKVSLYALGERSFALQQGKNWYLADTQTCTLQAAEAPAEKGGGKLIGAWQKRDGTYSFVPATAEPAGKPAG